VSLDFELDSMASSVPSACSSETMTSLGSTESNVTPLSARRRSRLIRAGLLVEPQYECYLHPDAAGVSLPHDAEVDGSLDRSVPQRRARYKTFRLGCVQCKYPICKECWDKG